MVCTPFADPARTCRGGHLPAPAQFTVADVAHAYYIAGMATTTVRLDEDDEHILDKLAPAFGGRSNAIRQALRQLSADVDRQQALESFLSDWQSTDGPIDEHAVEAMAQRYDL